MGVYYIQSNLNRSNADGLFTMANSNVFLSPYEILSIAQGNNNLWKFSSFYHEIVCCVYSLELSHRCDSNEYLEISYSNEYTEISYCIEDRIRFP